MHNYVHLSLWRDGVRAFPGGSFYPFADIVNLFKGVGSRCPDDHIGKELVASTAHPYPPYLHDTLNFVYVRLQLCRVPSWGAVEQSVNGFFCQLETNPDHYKGDAQ